ncbi:hypothetical membrane protein [Pelotomaculum thermopropionicum SI]|uniref:Hypothetical membrane protein n=1 Tax=Pelotomaculum thermopropionicum (strain DSM 13744 / JCM 10971 / SI) TaxID=370438 RepID=A5CZC0_PELTS|nr:hypothetical membrane protein [Pelotomaculum thermopropionicum SI]
MFAKVMTMCFAAAVIRYILYLAVNCRAKAQA